MRPLRQGGPTAVRTLRNRRAGCLAEGVAGSAAPPPAPGAAGGERGGCSVREAAGERERGAASRLRSLVYAACVRPARRLRPVTGRVTPLAGRYAECVRWGGAGPAARGHFLPPPFCQRTGGGSGGSCAVAAARPGPAASCAFPSPRSGETPPLSRVSELGKDRTGPSEEEKRLPPTPLGLGRPPPPWPCKQARRPELRKSLIFIFSQGCSHSPWYAVSNVRTRTLDHRHNAPGVVAGSAAAVGLDAGVEISISRAAWAAADRKKIGGRLPEEISGRWTTWGFLERFSVLVQRLGPSTTLEFVLCC
ncbi:uncharacterized protein VSU04_015753 [Chlamydotis macqueenii]